MDIRTTAVLLGVVNAVLAVALVLQYRFLPGQSGLGWWAAGQGCISVGLVLGDLRSTSVVGHLVIPVYHVVLVSGPLLIYVGIRRFLGRRERRAPIMALVVLVFVESTVFTFVLDIYVVRATALYAAVAAGLAMGAAAAIYDRTPDVDRPALFLGWVLGVAAAMYLLAAGWQAVRPLGPGESVFTPTPLSSFGFLIEIPAAVLWTFGMILMLNQRLTTEIQRDQANLRAVFESIPDTVVVSRLRDGALVDVNPGFSRVLGYTRADAVEGTLRGTDLWADSRQRARMVAALQATGTCQNLRGRMRRKDGSEVEVVLNARVLELGSEPHLVSVTRDISHDLAMQAQLRRDATTDHLTGVANRRHFLSLAAAAVDDARTRHGRLTIAVLDLDRLKEVNDTFGHARGDAAIAAFTARMGGSLPTLMSEGAPEQGVLGRLGGDEFGLLLPGTDAATGLDLVESLRRGLAASPTTLDQTPAPLTFSAGITAYDGVDDSVDAMLARADSAMYQAKHEGRDRIVLAPGNPPERDLDAEPPPGHTA